MLRTILNNHSDVCGVHECKLVYSLLARYGIESTSVDRQSLIQSIKSTHRAIEVFGYQTIEQAVSQANLNSFQVIDFCSELIKLRCQRENPKFIVDKNIGYHEIIDTLMEIPNSRFIIMVRNPLAAICSLRKKRMGISTFSTSRYRGDSLGDLAYYFHRTMPHLKQIVDENGSRVKLVRYEDLVQKPDTEIEKLCTWIDIPFQPEMLNFHLNTDEENAIPPDSIRRWHENIDKPIDASLANSWKNVLTSEEQWQIEGTIGQNVLTLFDYAPFAKKPRNISKIKWAGLYVKTRWLNHSRICNYFFRKAKT